MATKPKSVPRAAAFPIVIGAVDVGSNAVRYAAARFTSAGSYTLLEAERAPVRLGHGVFLTGTLGRESMSAAVEALGRFRERLDVLGARVRRAVATSAVREATNGVVFLERVRSEAGFDLKSITGAEEARLVHLAVAGRLRLGADPWLLADLGGGSVEVSLVDGTGIRWSESHTMGSVRLLEELTTRGEDPGRFLNLLEEYASTLRVPRASEDRPRGYIATGGNAESLAALAGAKPDARGVSRIPLADLRRIIELLARTSFRRRVDELGLREDRADVVLPAAIIYARLADLAGADAMVVPHVGIREGVLLDLAAEIGPGGGGARREKQAFDSALALGRKYSFDEPHGRQVSRLATSLFDQTEALHALGADSRRILMVAGLLHDVGSFVSRSGHHRHSHYLIAQSSLLGLGPEDVAVVAQVARYHRKGGPKPEHEAFRALPKADRQRTLKLAAILRIADALDREHMQRVREVQIRLGKETVRLLALGSGDLLLEAWSLRRKADFFEKVYTKKLTLETSRGGRP